LHRGVKVLKEEYHSYIRHSKHRDTLRFRLIASVVLVVLTTLTGSIIIDYNREFNQYTMTLLASLEEQARALKIAREQIKGENEFATYVDKFCAQMNDYISPGHHILVLDKNGEVRIRARHHSGVEVEEALLNSDSREQILYIGNHKLAQVRVTGEDGTVFVLAQYLDHLEGILHTQLFSRVFLWLLQRLF
jgi:hypothetical protein